jgi:hypothetical protein
MTLSLSAIKKLSMETEYDYRDGFISKREKAN